jgi:hypothetical protein
VLRFFVELFKRDACVDAKLLRHTAYLTVQFLVQPRIGDCKPALQERPGGVRHDAGWIEIKADA